MRDLALLGYIAVFLAIISSHYKRQVVKIFGRSFPNAHHILSVTGLALLTLHPIGVAWDELDAMVFIPVFFPINDMLRYGGRIAWYVLVVAALTAVYSRCQACPEKVSLFPATDTDSSGIFTVGQGNRIHLLCHPMSERP